MTTFFAYRLPFEESINYTKGISEWIAGIEALKGHAAIFHDFGGTRVLGIKQLEEINPTDFKSYFSEPVDQDESKQNYEKTFARLMQEIENGHFQKLILSRTQTVDTNQNALTLFNQLNKNYANTFNYVISHPEIGTWIGATPERLLSVSDRTVSTMSLAGTKTPEDNWTAKEYREQEYVTETILTVLEKVACTELISEGPFNLQAGQIEHLCTKISGKMNAEEDWKKIINTLHPTPAVCGIPTEEARKFIPQLESHQRQFYTGYIGLIGKNEGHFFVNLRCMQLFEKQARLYIGGGIIAGSEVEAEWRETERKAKTLLSFL